MNESDHVYEPPKRIPANEIPGPIADFLNGDDLESKTSLALRLSTVDAEGWPHACLLSAGDMLALPGGRIVPVQESRVTGVQNGVEPRACYERASVDPTDARRVVMPFAAATGLIRAGTGD